MFNKRRASTGVHMPKYQSQPVQTSTAAATAATTAFNKNADGGLSSAAAAAALRSHPLPTPRLAELQTKRLQRRLSNGSDVSRASAMTTGHIQNVTSPSRASLSDRTLRRSPSPAGRKPLESPVHVPPIPAIPANMIQSNAGRQRAASVDTPPSMPVPIPARSSRRTESVNLSDNKLDRLKQTTLAQASGSPTTRERSQETSRQQVNFSRPMSPQNSPRPRTAASESPQQGNGWFAGPVIQNNRMRHNVESVRDVVPVQSPVVKPPPLMDTDRKSHKFKKLLASTTGSVKTNDPTWKPTVVGSNASESSKWNAASTITSSSKSSSAAQASSTTSRTATKPEEFSSDHRLGPIIGDSQRQKHDGFNTPTVSSPTPEPNATAEPEHNSVDEGNDRAPRKIVLDQPTSAAINRSHSVSPRRSVQLDVALDEAVHHPLGRSASPVKSALKIRQPGLNRTVSNPAGTSVRHGDSASPAGTNRKKSVRINLEVKPGEDASGLGGSKYAPPTPVKAKSTFQDDMDGIMQPRPALPFFGSIRNQHRDHDSNSAGEGSSQIRESSMNTDSSSESPRHSLLAGKGVHREDVEKLSPSTRNNQAIEGGKKGIASNEGIESSQSSQPPAIVVKPTTPPVPASAGVESDSELESSDDESVYEDAAEELENYEFASLDQILEEPTPESVDMPNDYMDKPIKAPLLRQESGDTLALERRLEEARVNSEGRSKPIQPEPIPEQVTRSTVPADRKKTLRTNTPGEEPKTRTELPRSLRTSKWSPINAAQRQPQHNNAETYQRSSQASPTPQSSATNTTTLPVQHSPQKPLLTRKDSSDSVSSFKRSRKNKRNQDGRYTLRQSMRSASVDRFEPTPRGRSERRPQSPAEGNPQYKIRASMRTRSSDTSTSTSKNESTWKRLTSPARLTSKLRPSKGKESKSGKPTIGRRFSGSFAGSVADSEDDAPRRNFVSRFADSDDEDVELPPRAELPSTPVRGIPRASTQSQDDSTDLDDSDDERTHAPPSPVPTTKEIEQAHQPVKPVEKVEPKPNTTDIDGLASSKFAPTRPTHKRWSSFLGIGTHKHKLTQQSNASTPTLLNTPMQDSSPGKVKGKLRRKPRHVSQPSENTMNWPLKDESPKTNGTKATLPFMKRTESGNILDTAVGRPEQNGSESTTKTEEKPVQEVQDSRPPPRTNGTTSSFSNGVNNDNKAEKDAKSRFGRFKRMMKMSK